MMAFDGFVINQGLNPAAACTEEVADVLCAFLLGWRSVPARRKAAATAPRRPSLVRPVALAHGR
jgi:hypothetical protein